MPRRSSPLRPTQSLRADKVTNTTHSTIDNSVAALKNMRSKRFIDHQIVPLESSAMTSLYSKAPRALSGMGNRTV
jgi:hypothetical protein